jgi:hypothetical protein
VSDQDPDTGTARQTPPVACESCGQPIPPAEVPSKTDGRLPGDWESRYVDAAKKQIRREALYVAASVVVYLTLIAIVPLASRHEIVGIDPADVKPVAPQVLSFLGGCFGGTMFAMKWLYHSVAKYNWNADRRLWRYFTPILSGGGALCVVLLSSAGVLPLFGPDIVRSETGALGIGIVLGYFSDRVFSALEGFAKQNMPGTQTPSNSARPGTTGN